MINPSKDFNPRALGDNYRESSRLAKTFGDIYSKSLEKKRGANAFFHYQHNLNLGYCGVGSKHPAGHGIRTERYHRPVNV